MAIKLTDVAGASYLLTDDQILSLAEPDGGTLSLTVISTDDLTSFIHNQLKRQMETWESGKDAYGMGLTIEGEIPVDHVGVFISETEWQGDLKTDDLRISLTFKR